MRKTFGPITAASTGTEVQTKPNASLAIEIFTHRKFVSLQSSHIDLLQLSILIRWLGTVVTSHTASNRQAYTPVMSMLQKAVQSTHCKSYCTSCNQPAHTNVIMLYTVKCSLYAVGPFLCARTLHKVGLQGVKM